MARVMLVDEMRALDERKEIYVVLNEEGGQFLDLATGFRVREGETPKPIPLPMSQKTRVALEYGRLVVVDKPKGTKQRKEPEPVRSPITHAAHADWFNKPIDEMAARLNRVADPNEPRGTLTPTNEADNAAGNADVPAKAPETVSNGRNAAGKGDGTKPADNAG